VKKGYEEGDYESDYRTDRRIRDVEKEIFKQLFDQVKDDKVLDLGCGTGVPFDKFLVDKGYDLTGVDIAQKHVDKAKNNVPEADFIQDDFFELDFDQRSFDAVVSFYAIFHIPREDHKELLSRIKNWLGDGGLILITMGSEEMDMLEGEIGGEKMLWSSHSAEKNKKMVEDAGFEILESFQEDWREENHLWILGRKNGDKE
jgi:SAM-dependent methyltransferase